MTDKKERLYEFSVFITAKKLERVYNKKSPYYQNEFWRLWVETKNNEQVKQILVYQDFLRDPAIWKAIENNHWLDRRYWMLCNRKPGAGRIYRLVNWKELSNSFAERKELSKNHE